MAAQTKNEIIAEITTTTVKTIKQAIQDSLKVPKDFINKTTNEAVKKVSKNVRCHCCSNKTKVSRFQNLKIKEIKSVRK